MVAALGLFLRIAVVLTVPTQPVSDFWEYFERALHLAHDGRYEAALGIVDASHPPAYPLLLAIGFRAVPGADPLLLAKLINCLLGTLSIAIGARLALLLWGERAALLAAVAFALYPRYLLMPCLLASENLFAPLLLLFVYLIAKSFGREQRLRLAAAAGCVVGLLALTRSVAYALGVIWIAGAWAMGRRWRTILAELAILLALQHAVMVPWAARNKRELGRFTFLNSVGGVGLFIGNNPRATGEWYEWQADLERAQPGILSKTAVEIDDAARLEALRWIRNHKRGAAELYLEKLRLMLVQDTTAAGWAIYGQNISPPVPPVSVLPGPHWLKDHRRFVILTLRTAAALLCLLGFGGLILLLRQALRSRAVSDRAIAAMFFAAVAYIPLLSALIAVNGRYRWPSEDVLLPVAAMFVAWLTGRRDLTKRTTAASKNDESRTNRRSRTSGVLRRSN